MPNFFPVLYGSVCNFDTSFVTSSSGSLTFEVHGPFVYAVDDTADFLKIWDISNPTSPVLKSNTSLPASSDAQHPWYHNGYLLICSYTPKKLLIYDVSNPSSPTLVGTQTGLSGNPVRVAAIGTVACVIYADGFVQTNMAEKVDISTPASPTIVDNWTKASGTGLASGIGVTSTDFVIAGQNSSNGQVYIATVNASTFNSEDVKTDGFITAGISQDVSVSDDATLAFTTNNGQPLVTSWNISNPASISLLNQLSLTGTGTGASYLAYRSTNGFLYYGRGAGNDLKIIIIDASNPSSMTQTGTISTSSETVADISIIDDSCATLAYAQGTGSAIFLKGTPPTS